MANELTIGASLKFSKGGVEADVRGTGIQLDVAGSKKTELTQTVGTAEEPLLLGDIAAPGYCLMKNLSSVNPVHIRPGTGENNLITVRAGGIALFQLAATAPYIIADTAAVDVELTIIEA